MVFQVAQLENKKKRKKKQSSNMYPPFFYLKIDILPKFCPVLSGFAANAQ